jgi:outer membrane protein
MPKSSISRNLFCGVLSLSLLLLVTGEGWAQAFLPASPESVLAATIDSIPGAPLALTQALDLAVQNATAVKEARAGVEAAQGAVRREKGTFDPELFANVLRSGSDQLTSSPFSGAPVVNGQAVLSEDVTTASGGARMKLPLGTELEASINSMRTRNNSTFALLNPVYDTFGILSLRQPLLAGFGPSARAGLSSAERGLASAEALYRDVVLGTQSQTEGAYWDLYAAERDFAVQSVIRDRARTFVTEAEARAQAGLVGPSAVASAKVFLATQELTVLDSEERLDQVSDRLATLLGVRASGAPRYRAVDAPPRDHVLAPVDELVAQAIEKNHALQSQREVVNQLKALARGAAWDAWPTLDVVGSLGGNGLSGSPHQVVFGTDTLNTNISGDFSDTWNQVWSRDFPTWSVGLELTFPLGRREGRGERDRLQAEVARAEQFEKASEQTLEEDVRQAHRELVHAQSRLSVAQDGVTAALEQVRIGSIEFQNGRTSAFELVRLGGDVATSQQHYSEALVTSAKAAALLKYLTSGAYTGVRTP